MAKQRESVAPFESEVAAAEPAAPAKGNGTGGVHGDVYKPTKKSSNFCKPLFVLDFLAAVHQLADVISRKLYAEVVVKLN